MSVTWIFLLHRKEEGQEQEQEDKNQAVLLPRVGGAALLHTMRSFDCLSQKV